MPILSVHIQPAPSGGWAAAWRVDGHPVGAEVPISPAVTRELAEFSKVFQPAPDPTARTSGGRRPLFPADVVRVLGDQFRTRICPEWDDIRARFPAGPVTLHVCTNLPAALNLPWELLPFGAGSRPVGTDPEWGLYRVPEVPESPPPALRPGPLRILFLAASAEGGTVLDYEREEEAILRAVSASADVVLFIAELGTIEELAERVESFRPHVVHLSGHGKMKDDGTAVFAFEDDRGRHDLRPAADLVKAFGTHPVRMVFVNGCETGQAAVAGLCQAVVGAGVPLALGWAASVADDLATDFADTLYTHLARGDSAAASVAHARARIARDGLIPNACPDGSAAQDMTFALPHLYAAYPDVSLYDRTKRDDAPAAKTEYVLLPNGVEGLRDGFIGRRRDQQALIPPLRDGEFTVVVLHGIGGQGKSTLATRIANRLGLGLKILAVKPKQREGETAAACARRTVDDLLDEFRTAYGEADRPDVYKRLTNPDYAPADKLKFAVDAMNEVPFLLVLDNWEDVLDLGTRAVADSALATFYRRLMTHLTQKSRAIVTTRFVPDGTPTDAKQVVVRGSLQDFKDHDFRKFLRRDEAVARRMRPYDLSDEFLTKLFHSVGGTPRFLGLLLKILHKADPDDLRAELAQGSGLVSQERDRYIEGIFGARLYAALADDGRLVVTRLAVSLLPVPAEGAAVASGLPLDRATTGARDAARYGLLQEFSEPDRPTLYQPPGLLVGWLAHPARLPAEAATAAHRALAGFWQGVFKKEREAEMRAPTTDGLDACRRHARDGGDPQLTLWATNWMAHVFDQFGDRPRARGILAEVIRIVTVDDAELDKAWHHLASIDLHEGKYADARGKLTQVMSIQSRIGNAAGEAATWHLLANIDLHEGKYQDARDKLARSRAIKQQIGDTAGEAVTWELLANIDLREGKYQDARDKCRQAMSIRQRIGNTAGEADTWALLGSIDIYEGKYPEARGKFEQAMNIMKHFQNLAGEATTWHGLATIDMQERKYADARDKFARALTIRQRIGDIAGEAATWHNLANIDIYEGKYSDARHKFGHTLAIKQQIGEPSGEADAWHGLANIDVNEVKYNDARDKFTRALAIRQRIGEAAKEAATWHGLASIDNRERKYGDARNKFARVLVIQQRIGEAAGEADAWHNLADIDIREGKHNDARHKFARSLAIKQRIGDSAGEALIWHGLASIDIYYGDINSASDKIIRSLAIFQRIGDTASEATAWSQLGIFAWQIGQRREAVRLTALCYLLDQSAGRKLNQINFDHLASYCYQLSYKQDGGRALLRAAFPGLSS